MKLTNEQLKGIYFGAYFFEETADGYLKANQYSKAQMAYFDTALEMWKERCDASTAKTLEFVTEATEVSFDYKLIWFCSKDSFDLYVDGNDGAWVSVKCNGTATITAHSSDGIHSASCTVMVTPKYEYVDLGLSVKWATFNVGATRPEEYGDYFAWGATEPLYQPGYAQSSSPLWKSGKTGGYNFVNTPFQTVNTEEYPSSKWTKYLGSTTSSYKDPSATNADALKTVLDLEDDAAHVNWGGSWRMPTYEELKEVADIMKSIKQ